jgi:hypothetical protein
VKAILRVLIVWMTLLAVPLQGFASATISLCVPPTATLDSHDHGSLGDDADMSSAHLHDEHAGPDMQTDHHPASHHQAGKCATCATCGACVPMAPSFVAIPPVTASSSTTIPFDQQLLPSIYLALLERPPRV